MIRPLDGITVVSLEHAIAAPFCTRQLADLGARVIKVERPGTGDFARAYDSRVKGLASHFVWTNRSKESLTLDLKQPGALAALKTLLGQADVLVQNLAPGAAARMGLGYDALSPAHPGLIVCDISGYGDDGPYRDFAATDEAFRIRRIGVRNFLTYKGPKRDKQTKSRTELELPIADGPDAATIAVKMLTHLGYRPVAVVTKTRDVYRFQRDGFSIEACFDDVGSVGRFVELEIQADEADYESAKSVLLATATMLGLQEQERHSYLELLLAQPTPTPAPRG